MLEIDGINIHGMDMMDLELKIDDKTIYVDPYQINSRVY